MELDKIMKDFTIQGPIDGKRSHVILRFVSSYMALIFFVSIEPVEGDDLLDLMDNL